MEPSLMGLPRALPRGTDSLPGRTDSQMAGRIWVRLKECIVHRAKSPGTASSPLHLISRHEADGA